MKLSELIIRFPSFSDARGTLSVADALTPPHIPFTAHRLFWINDVPAHIVRGGHAHRSCHELVVCSSGSCQITLTLPKHLLDGLPANENAAFVTQTFHLNAPDEALWIPAMVWCRLEHFSEHCTLLCLASEPYNASGYINDFEAFQHECQNESR